MTATLQRAILAGAAAMSLAVVAGCGGSGGGSIVPVRFEITTTTLPDGVVGSAYSATIAVTGGNGAKTFSISAGDLPAGLALNTSSGAITGTPTAAGTANFTVMVVDSSTPQQSDTQTLTIDIVSPLAITTAVLPGTSLGAAYDQTIVASGGTAPYTFSITSGSLPAGLAISAGGRITGTATASATTQTFTVRIADSSSPQLTDTAVLTISVTLEITTTTLPDATIGTAYSQTISATGGSGARTFSIPAGSLPAGLALNTSSGAIAGTPTGSTGTASFTAMVVDSGTPQQSDTQALGITVNAAASGRNDTIATATPLGNGSFSASISPSGHPNTVLAPDEDYYRITTTAASTVTVDINAESQGSPLDSVIEIVDGSGVLLGTCVAPAFSTACEHDDEVSGEVHDSRLVIQVAGATTFYVHVVDYRGAARPDFLYDIVISGVN